MEVKRITPEQDKELLDSNQDYISLDVRTVPEFAAGHVPGAKNVPVVEPDASGRMQLNPRFVEIVEASFVKDVKCITGSQKWPFHLSGGASASGRVPPRAGYARRIRGRNG
jgi:hypothetical protein